MTFHIWSKKGGVLGTVLVSALAISACSTGAPGDPVLAAPLRIDPAAASVLPGTTKLLAATNSGGESLLWTSSDSAIARVEQSGFVRAVRQGTATITARSLTMPARAATSVLTIEGINGCLCGGPVGISLSQVLDARTKTSALLNATHDSVDVVALVTEWRLGSRLELVITGPRDTVLSRPVPPDFFEGGLPIRWDTGVRLAGQPVYPNGDYSLSVRLVNAGVVTRSANSVPATVLNP